MTKLINAQMNLSVQTVRLMMFSQPVLPDSQEGVELSKPHLLFLSPSLHGESPYTDLLWMTDWIGIQYSLKLIPKFIFFITQNVFNTTELKACVMVNLLTREHLDSSVVLTKRFSVQKMVVQSLFSYHYNI